MLGVECLQHVSTQGDLLQYLVWVHDGEEDIEDTTTKEMFEAIDRDKAVQQKRAGDVAEPKKSKGKKKKKKSSTSSTSKSPTSKSSSSSSSKAYASFCFPFRSGQEEQGAEEGKENEESKERKKRKDREEPKEKGKI